MEKRFVLFIVLSFAILVGYQYLMLALFPPKPKPPVAQLEPADQAKPDAKVEDGPGKGDKPEGKPGEKPDAKPEEKLAKPQPKEKPAEKPEEKPAVVKPEPVVAEQWVTLGSADPASPYRMLVTLTNRGAAVAAIELNSPRYQDLTDEHGYLYDRSGYLGRVSIDETVGGAGCLVQVVGPGTPAEKAGLMPGDLIAAIDDQPIQSGLDLRMVLKKTRPKQTVLLAVRRGGKDLSLEAVLGERPLAVVRPEAADPLSFLLTMARIDKNDLGAAPPKEEEHGKPPADLDAELEGVRLRNANWAVEKSTPAEVVFRRKLARWGLELTKTYRLEEVPAESMDDLTYPAYHLKFEIGVRNADEVAHEVAYQLDGPTGLPVEGWWYSTKVGHGFSGVGVRDVAAAFDQGALQLIGCPRIAANAVKPLPWKENLDFIGVDAQYFSAVLIPQKGSPEESWFAGSWPMNVGEVPPQHPNLANTSFRLVSTARALKPNEAFQQEFVVFAGPKKPPLLAHYAGGKLGDLVYYGWFSVVAEPMVRILHGFYYLVGNYGIAIIMLTCLVRLCMFPLSRKQTLSALKMQELQPEIKKIQEKYKKDQEAKIRAQQELFRKHNYNPLGGCLVVFIQIPIFLALYRSLMVDVELRQAPLLWESLRWCSNLAAPDMTLDWSRWAPNFIIHGLSIFPSLGPYFNVLPIITIFLFLWQQKKLMPPPADEQAAMQQKIMKYMMIFMGLLFFKVASGLCIYFIASSLWGMGERRFLPKAKKPGEETSAPTDRTSFFSPAPSNGDGRSAAKKKKRSRGKR